MVTEYKGNEKELLVLNTWIKLSRATSTVIKIFRPTVEHYGLTISQFGVLELLMHLGPQTQKTISDKLLISGGNMVTVLDNLERDGLVKRRPYPGDRRSYLVHLEQKGDTLITTVFKEHLKDLLSTFNDLTDAEKKELGRLCKKVGFGLKTKE
ncbi:MAG: MarR family transcriptional regulator [Candidatus Marinimicrobia bacterium]|nr:MarR family transcriptional regulator [Candidatus Neomarinimicrobiota bacterium]